MIVRTIFYVWICVLALPAVALADGLVVKHAATLPTPGGIDSAAIYVVVENPTLQQEALVAASSPLAASGELNNTRLENGVPEHQPISLFPILPVSYTVMGPGNAHIKLLGLARPLVVGDKVPVVLTFRNAGEHHVTAEVLPADEFVKLYPVETTLLTIKRLKSN